MVSDQLETTKKPWITVGELIDPSMTEADWDAAAHEAHTDKNWETTQKWIEKAAKAIAEWKL